MPTLFDALQNVKQKQAPAQQQELQRIARARGGKAQIGVGPAVSAVGEQRALAAGQTAAQQQAQQAGLAAQGLRQQEAQTKATQALTGQAQQQQFQEQLSGIAQQAELGQERIQQQRTLGGERLAADKSMSLAQMSNTANNKLQQLAADRDIQIENLFQTFNRSNLSLEDRQDAAELEQLGFVYSMQDQAYLNELDQIGRQRGLEDNLAFQEESMDIALGNNLSKVIDDLGLQRALGADARTAQREVADIDIDTALQIGRASAKDAAIGNVLSAGGQFAQTDYAKNLFKEEQ